MLYIIITFYGKIVNRICEISINIRHFGAIMLGSRVGREKIGKVFFAFVILFVDFWLNILYNIREHLMKKRTNDGLGVLGTCKNSQ